MLPSWYVKIIWFVIDATLLHQHTKTSCYGPMVSQESLEMLCNIWDIIVYEMWKEDGLEWQIPMLSPAASFVDEIRHLLL